MATQIFVNLPIKNLDRSKEFFTKIGFSINPQFSNEKGCLRSYQRNHLCNDLNRRIF